jgi:hypothetical protein
VDAIGVVGLDARRVRDADADAEAADCVEGRRNSVGVSATGAVLVLWCFGADGGFEGFSAFSFGSRGGGGAVSRSLSRSLSLSLLLELLREWRPKRDGMSS